MAAPTVRQIRAGFATRLATISGLRTFDTIPGRLALPAGVVGMPERRPVLTMIKGTDEWHVPIWVIVARYADAQSEKAIEAYLNPTGASSVRAAINGDRTLGGVVNDVFEEFAQLERIDLGAGDTEISYLSIAFEYRVLAPGKD